MLSLRLLQTKSATKASRTNRSNGAVLYELGCNTIQTIFTASNPMYKRAYAFIIRARAPRTIQTKKEKRNEI